MSYTDIFVLHTGAAIDLTQLASITPLNLNVDWLLVIQGQVIVITSTPQEIAALMWAWSCTKERQNKRLN